MLQNKHPLLRIILKLHNPESTRCPNTPQCTFLSFPMQIQPYICICNVHLSPFFAVPGVYQAREGRGKTSQPTKKPSLLKENYCSLQGWMFWYGYLESEVGKSLPSFAYQYPSSLLPNAFLACCCQTKWLGMCLQTALLYIRGLLYHSPRLVLHQQNFNKTHQAAVRWHQRKGTGN